RLDVLGRLLLLGPADLPDHDDGLGVGIGLEAAQTVDEARTRDGITADAHARRLADASLGELVESLVGERARAGHDADRPARFGDLARGDADVALAGRDHPRAVGADELGFRVLSLEAVVHEDLVLGRDPL